jgi:hypothetical protein
MLKYKDYRFGVEIYGAEVLSISALDHRHIRYNAKQLGAEQC